jgi:hypothetical protein
MQAFNPRPSLQSAQRPTGSFNTPVRSLQVPARGPLRYAPPINHAMHHRFDDAINVPPQYRDHAAASQSPPHAYSNSNAVLFGAPIDQPHTYTPGVISRVPRHDFPFKAMLVALIVVAAAAGVYAGIRIFSNPDQVNADDIINTAAP